MGRSLHPPPRRDRIAAARPLARRAELTEDWDLGVIILRMIATQSLAAFTPAISRGEPVRGISPTPGSAAGRVEASAPAPAPLEMVPAQPGRPMPRGSLLDLRV